MKASAKDRDHNNGWDHGGAEGKREGQKRQRIPAQA